MSKSFWYSLANISSVKTFFFLILRGTSKSVYWSFGVLLLCINSCRKSFVALINYLKWSHLSLCPLGLNTASFENVKLGVCSLLFFCAWGQQLITAASITHRYHWPNCKSSSCIGGHVQVPGFDKEDFFIYLEKYDTNTQQRRFVFPKAATKPYNLFVYPHNTPKATFYPTFTTYCSIQYMDHISGLKWPCADGV